MLPSDLIESLKGLPGFDETDFVNIHKEAKPPVSIRGNSRKWKMDDVPFKMDRPVPWCKNGFYLKERPVFTLDPLLHAGAYYVQEASSMFLEQAVKRVLSEIKVNYALDLCAAPGGKSTHLLDLLPDDAVLVSNEVVASRVNILLENIIKWGNANVVVTQNDPLGIGKLTEMFDLMVVDAPCSGSGLFRRDPEAVSEWSLNHVELCSQRQKRILAEGVSLEWPDCQNGVVLSESPVFKLPCYRFYPGKVEGEGLFIALFRKSGQNINNELVAAKKNKERKAADLPLSEWLMQADGLEVFRHKEIVFAMPALVHSFYQAFHKKLNIRKSGVRMGEWVHSKLNPDHELALAQLLKREGFPLVNLEKEQALSFLRREAFDISDNVVKSWNLIVYEGYSLGWIKNIGNRFNNYYPKEWRIRMQS
ncbi:MAG: hypothetical protein MUE99_07005 [Chitinophagaceae bacterium]|nr:hypothetical protein [Chitinophagaceae bacterium]